MRLTIVNSTAPGTASLLAPFFAAVADAPEMALTVMEQMAARDAARAQAESSARRYRLEPAPTYWYHRRHACAQVLAPGFGRQLQASCPDAIYLLGEAGYLSSFQVVRFARRHLPATKLFLFAAQNVYQQFPPPFPSVERWVLARIDHAFPLGCDHEDVLRRKGYRGAVTHLPLGVDARVFAPARHDALKRELNLPSPVAGYVGDFLPARNLPLLIQAVAALRPPVGLLIVGDGPGREDLQAQCQALGIGDRTRFVGRVPHTRVPDYLNCMDLVVLPSIAVRNRCFGLFEIANAEQFGRALIEAMACGKPVVGSTCGEIPTVIGNAGRVFREGDLGALTSVLEKLCANPALRKRLGQAGLARARTHYDWRVIAGRFVATVEEIVLGAQADAKRRYPDEARTPAATAAAS